MSGAAGPIAVVGSDGFIGGHLVKALRAEGRDVHALGRRPGNASLVVDITDAAMVKHAMSAIQPSVVIHLAGLAHQQRGAATSGAYDEVNHRGFRNVLEASAGIARRIVLASSTSVYGDLAGKEPLGEHTALAPSSAYGRSKVAAEQACLDASPLPIEKIIFRFPALYAPDFLLNVRKRAYIPGMERRVLLAIVGEQPRYSFCSIETAIAAFRLAIDGRLPHGTYNVADAQAYTQRDVRAVVGTLDRVRMSVPLPGSVLLQAADLAAPIFPARARAFLLSNMHKLFSGLVLDTSRIRDLGLQQEHSLRDLVDGHVRS